MKTGTLRGNIIELESAVPELEGQRVRVIVEPLEEPALSSNELRDLGQSWVERGPQGPIQDDADTEFP